MSEALGFTREQTPCASTLHQVFGRLDREAFETELGQWLQERGLSESEAVAIDGKALRGIHGDQLPGVHLVAAYADQAGIVVGQQAVGEKKNELDAVAGLLGQLDLPGLVVTGDAQFTPIRPTQNLQAAAPPEQSGSRRTPSTGLAPSPRHCLIDANRQI